jgi:hypothetical protein
MRHRMHRHLSFLGCATLSLAWTLSAPPCHAAGTSVEGAHGIVATIDEESGRYEVRSREPSWVFAGKLGGAASDISVKDGQDRLGAFRELSFRWKDQVALRGSIRTYVDHPVLLFGITSSEPTPEAAVIRFPWFTEFPKNPHGFSYANNEFAPPKFSLEENATPWLLYDEQTHAAVLSPAANYMIASMRGDGKTEIASGLNKGVAGLPADFTHLTLMALGVGVNATWDSWGNALTGLQGTQRPGNDADIGLRYLGYWTDHGGEYYYDYDRKLGYAGTLEALVQRYRDEEIPIRYLQLDSRGTRAPAGTPCVKRSFPCTAGEPTGSGAAGEAARQPRFAEEAGTRLRWHLSNANG